MVFGGKKAALLLFAGDLAVFGLSLWLTLLLRYQALPTQSLLLAHLPFVPLFAVWTLVFYMSGLYSKRVLLSQRELTGTIFRTQILNILLGALYFFLVPGVGITPKTNLAIYFGVSLALTFVWRLALVPRLTRPSFREPAALVGEGPDVDELVAEVNRNPRYPFAFRIVVDSATAAADLAAFGEHVRHERVTLVVADASSAALQPILPELYRLTVAERRAQFVDLYKVYEEVFDRVPLSLLRYEWFVRHASRSQSRLYGVLKRLVDLVGGMLMGLVTLVALPFVWLAMHIEGPGPLFIAQQRFGKFGVPMQAYKFRSMTHNDAAAKVWVGEGDNRVTRVGAILRKTSLDEFPQFLNILRGELSLVGPRNDILGLGERLSEALPYYQARYLVKPGITGWAQINQRYEPGNISPQSIDETKVRLAYDFYYIKNRSLPLDILIALRTIKRMLFRVSNL